MTGLLAVYAFDDIWRVGKYVYYGLLALQHRGQGSVKVYALSNNDLVEAGVGEVTQEYFTELTGWSMIAAAFPEYIDVGRCSYLAEGRGLKLAVLLDSSPHGPPAEEVAELMHCRAVEEDLLRAAEEVVPELDGVNNRLALSSTGEVVAYRSTPGLRPLVVGGYGFDMVVVSSEAPAINIVGGDVRRSVLPGELVYVNRYLVRGLRLRRCSKCSLCALELVYMARPDSTIDGVEVYEFRRRLGERLAEVFRGDVDVVVGVPETAVPYAVGLAQALGKRFEVGFVSTGSRTRSALKVNPVDRLATIQLKMNPVRGVFVGKRVALVDDSLVTGSTAKTVIQILRNRVGAKEVHLLLASPKIVRECPHGLPLPGREELLAANLDDDLALKYVEADSITWIPTEVLEGTAREFGVNLCLSCLEGGGASP